MTTTIEKPARRTLLRGPAREVGGSTGLDRGLARLVEERPTTASPTAAFVSGIKAIAPVLLALMPFALAFGTSATGSGLSPLEAFGMSVFVFAGAAQLAMLPLIQDGAPVAVVVVTVLIINLRLMLYSASLAPHFRGLSAGWKGWLSYLLTDQAYAATITRFDEGRVSEPNKRWFYLGVAMPIGAVWFTTSMLGVFLGSRVPHDWQLDFVLPLIFIALAVRAINDRTTGAAAIVAGTTAMSAAAMPLNLGLITAALIGVAGGMVADLVIGRSEK